MPKFSVVVTAAVCAMIPMAAQPKLGLPSLGFVPDAGGGGLRAIVGVPGASVLKGAIDAGMPLTLVTVSPRHDSALALQAESRQAVRIDLTGARPAATPIEGLEPNATSITFSPSGSAAAFYFAETGAIRLVKTGAGPREAWHAGQGTVLAVSDDGERVLHAGKGDQADQLLLVTAGGTFRIGVVTAKSAAFFPGSSDAVVTDGPSRRLHAVRNGALETFAVLEGSPSAVAISSDGQRVLIAAAEPSEILVYSAAGEPISKVASSFTPESIAATAEENIYRLNGPGAGPLYLLDARQRELAILFVPVGVAE